MHYVEKNTYYSSNRERVAKSSGRKRRLRRWLNFPIVEIIRFGQGLRFAPILPAHAPTARRTVP